MENYDYPVITIMEMTIVMIIIMILIFSCYNKSIIKKGNGNDSNNNIGNITKMIMIIVKSIVIIEI